MQVTRNNELQSRRLYNAIGRIEAHSSWRAITAPLSDADRQEAVVSLIREAQEYDADAIVSLGFDVDSVKCIDIEGIPLRRVAASGVAVRFADISRTSTQDRG